MSNFNFLYENADIDFVSNIIEDASFNFVLECVENNNTILVETLITILKGNFSNREIEDEIFETLLDYVEDSSRDFIEMISEAEIHNSSYSSDYDAQDQDRRQLNQNRWGKETGRQSGEALGYKQGKRDAERSVSYSDISSKYAVKDNIRNTNRLTNHKTPIEKINLNPSNNTNNKRFNTQYSKLSSAANKDVQQMRKTGNAGMGYSDGYRSEFKKGKSDAYDATYAKTKQDKLRQVTAQVLQDRNKTLVNQKKQDNAAIRAELKAASLAQRERRPSSQPHHPITNNTPLSNSINPPSTKINRLKQFGSSISTGVRNGLIAARNNINKLSFKRK